MRAEFCGCGLIITLVKKDRDELEEKGELECRLHGWKKPKLVLHVVDEVPEKGSLEEPGFHIEVTPPKAGPETRDGYNVYLSRERFTSLVNPEEDPVIYGGHFVSRSMYDRVEFNYWGV